jgi:hypothetical protein
MGKETMTRNKNDFEKYKDEFGIDFNFNELSKMKIPKLWEIEILNNEEMKKQLYEMVRLDEDGEFIEFEKTLLEVEKKFKVLEDV